MQHILLLALASLSFSAFAHITPGTYTGVTPDGNVCRMTVAETFFENGEHHPLNERIRVTVANTEFLVRHPAAIDKSAEKVTFDHDRFEGLAATSTGAMALIVPMDHSKGEPVSYHLIMDDWKAKVSITEDCGELTLQAQRP